MGLYVGLFPGQSNFLQSCHHCALQPLQEITEQNLTVGGVQHIKVLESIFGHICTEPGSTIVFSVGLPTDP